MYGRGMFRTGNPALRAGAFRDVQSVGSSDVMTIQGTVNKTAILLLLCLFSASWVWKNPAMIAYVMPFALIAFIVAMVAIFKKEWAGIMAPIYALVEGCLLGALSLMFEKTYPGIVVQAIGLTFGTLFSLLIAYKSKLIPVTQNFRLGVTAATGGICLFYMISMIMSFFGSGLPMIHSSSLLGIGFSFFVVIIASLNLVLDFDFIEQGSQYGAPKYMEWYAAFGLMVTLVWLYIEILRLLSKLRSR